MDYEQPQSASETTPTPEPNSTPEHQFLTADPSSTPESPTENPWIETLKTIGLSAVLALGIRSFVAEARFIPSGSMLPTLQIDDRLIIDKISYRFTDPTRGDIVVFNPTPQLEKEKYKDAFIKRVIGLPGDRIDVKGGKVYLNGKVLSEKYIEEPPNDEWSTTDKMSSGDHPISWPANGRVPKDSYLVLGDNRNNSYDSHFWGFVPKDKIVGKATLRFWPINRIGGIDPNPDYK
jgi:signal peptidase I